jgi:hypothetical protein
MSTVNEWHNISNNLASQKNLKKQKKDKRIWPSQ